MVKVIFSERFLDHKTGRFHPESPQRLTAIQQRLMNGVCKDKLHWLEPRSNEENQALYWVQKIHDHNYIDRIKTIASRGGGKLDEDTAVSAQSYDVALLAVGAWLDGVNQVLGDNQPCFILARPPGHHATAKIGMGFCLFSNAAIAANYALTLKGVEKVAILDWDVHHGNGTEDIIADNPNIIYCSLHQYPCYPGTGKVSDRGCYDNVLNIPLEPRNTIKEYEGYFQYKVIPFITQFQPDLLIVSAGYDANYHDPLASMSLFPQDYYILTQHCLKITKKVVFGLEGGYHLEALAESVEQTLLSCLEFNP
ncbi:histone deacetylase [Geminocystis sp. NIES-3709]|uniref:histone deacetylase family protein n=1 Tax=Geminocystis sp. NIES-3709 TaxID=1617448 RepID=UPI0005FCA33F|nr:histone deacetylase [Geminocystis sp. NIES-3709]BAQ65906.1 deacetylases [Geminocystis sp. NIES-3709]